jgi:hypothetical protein
MASRQAVRGVSSPGRCCLGLWKGGGGSVADRSREKFRWLADCVSGRKTAYILLCSNSCNMVFKWILCMYRE